jgi:hypothetical protein
MKRRCERCGFVAPVARNVSRHGRNAYAAGARFVRINAGKTNTDFFFNQWHFKEYLFLNSRVNRR